MERGACDTWNGARPTLQRIYCGWVQVRTVTTAKLEVASLLGLDFVPGVTTLIAEIAGEPVDVVLFDVRVIPTPLTFHGI